MRKLTIIVALACAVPLNGCVTVPSPAALANSTKADEQGINTLELAYKTWRLAVETGVNAGTIKGQLAGHIADIDNKLYSALQSAEAAYQSANSTTYNDAVKQFNTALADGYASIGGK